MPPRSLDDLKPAEQLLVLSCRRTMSGRCAGPCVEMAWRLGCGDGPGGASAQAFEHMSRQLHAAARRRLQLNAPHTAALSMDERSVLELVCACQNGAFALAVPLARWLVRSPGHVSLLGTAAALARVMEEAGLRLRPPEVFRADGVVGVGV